MSKAEMYEEDKVDGSLTLEQGTWLAKNVLGLERVNFVSDALKDSCEEWIWVSSDRMQSYREKKVPPCLTIFEYLKTPDGFFAVWDAVEKIGWMRVGIFKTYTDYRCDIAIDLCGGVDSYGKDRYEAFYNAVYEAMKSDE